MAIRATGRPGLAPPQRLRMHALLIRSQLQFVAMATICLANRFCRDVTQPSVIFGWSMAIGAVQFRVSRLPISSVISSVVADSSLRDALGVVIDGRGGLRCRSRSVAQAKTNKVKPSIIFAPGRRLGLHMSFDHRQCFGALLQDLKAPAVPNKAISSGLPCRPATPYNYGPWNPGKRLYNETHLRRKSRGMTAHRVCRPPQSR